MLDDEMHSRGVDKGQKKKGGFDEFLCRVMSRAIPNIRYH
jgi:hypothetical protein